jgi:hypothetical protein
LRVYLSVKTDGVENPRAILPGRPKSYLTSVSAPVN